MTHPSFQQYANQAPQGNFPPGYGQQQSPQYPPGYAPQQIPQGYGQALPPNYQPQAPQGPTLAQGSLDEYFNQPSVGGGPSLKFDEGTTHVGVVARRITNADIAQQTIPNSNTPAVYKDGSPKFVMKVPLVVPVTEAHQDGQAQWYVAGSARDELVRAMSAAGAPAGPPEEGSFIKISCVGKRPIPGMSAAKIYRVEYHRPEGAAATTAPAATPVHEVTAPPVPSPAATAAPQPPPEMTPEQQALLTRMTAGG